MLGELDIDSLHGKKGLYVYLRSNQVAPIHNIRDYFKY